MTRSTGGLLDCMRRCMRRAAGGQNGTAFLSGSFFWRIIAYLQNRQMRLANTLERHLLENSPVFCNLGGRRLADRKGLG